MPDVWATARAFSLRVIAATLIDDGYGHSPGSAAYSYADTEVSLGLGYRVQLYAGAELVQERESVHEDAEPSATLEFSGLASDTRYEVVAVAYNKAGEGLPVSFPVFTRPWQCEGETLASATGSGSESAPWQIVTLCQLQDIRSAPAAYYRLASDIEAGPSQDWRDGKGFAPIDDFSGSLDGAGQQIFHLTVNSEAQENVGLSSQLQS